MSAIIGWQLIWPALNNPDFLAAADDTFLWATIAYGRRETPMFPSLRGLGGVRQLSAQEIRPRGLSAALAAAAMNKCALTVSSSPAE
jgi:hypothetical protein